MPGELALFVQEAGSVATMVSKVARACLSVTMAPRHELDRLQILAEKSILIALGHAEADLARRNISEIAETARELQRHNLEGDALHSASRQLIVLGRQLERNLEQLGDVR